VWSCLNNILIFEESLCCVCSAVVVIWFEHSELLSTIVIISADVNSEFCAAHHSQNQLTFHCAWGLSFKEQNSVQVVCEFIWNDCTKKLLNARYNRVFFKKDSSQDSLISYSYLVLYLLDQVHHCFVWWCLLSLSSCSLVTLIKPAWDLISSDSIDFICSSRCDCMIVHSWR
jgi:hypothetical protein